MKNILLISAFLFLGACANDKGQKTDIAAVPAPTVNNNTIQPDGGLGVQPQPQPYPQPQQYGYHYNDARCTTGPQRFPSVRAYCEGLRNERRNNYCAAEARYNDFRQYCVGHRWQR